MLLPVVFVGLAAALGSAAGASVTTGQPGRAEAVDRRAPAAQLLLDKTDRLMLRRIIRHRNSTWRWQSVMLRPRTPYTGAAEKSPSRAYRRWVLRVWEKRAKVAWRKAQRPPHYDEWLCIHRYEGSWTDPNAPYYGGLQMDMSFQRTYGWNLLQAKGTADNWSPLEQMWVAERAYQSGRGFYPWPNTARYCGLL
ncbi:MAG TPA: hypothetical protein VFR32_09155 [Gaiellaceae bacterium]|nr:hypothetical protein [Gaiellaceae bacterium]